MFPLSYSYHLQPNFVGDYAKETFKHYKKKSLAQALLAEYSMVAEPPNP